MSPAKAMSWQPLARFRDTTVPKLENLRRAARAGLTVPPTVWAWAADLERAAEADLGRLPEAVAAFPCVVRSGSPTEDTRVTSNAGQLLSLVVNRPEELATAVARVVASLPRGGGRPLGVVFVQPLVHAEAAGITFFDGFYFEETWAPGSNVALTSGKERGQVHRGHVRRGDLHHAWLLRVHRVFGGQVDLEWARPQSGDGSEPVLLQVRPALFPIRRCETLSLANHKEILGDPPSPWMVGVLTEISRPVMQFFHAIDPATAAWEESYAIELGERGWMNFSAFFRLMDRWGLPRTMVTDGVGGESDGPADARMQFGRIIRSIPALARLGLASLAAITGIRRGIDRLDHELDRAGSLLELQQVNVRALEFSVRTNIAIMSPLSVLSRLRRAIGLEQAAQVVTQTMMAEYARLAALPELADRLRGLDRWLAQYGHRGPLESDPCRPRFIELREMLQNDLSRGPAPLPSSHTQPTILLATVGRPLFLLDECRERFRDHLMRWWQRLRSRILEEARRATAEGWLDAPDDAFFLRREDLEADPSTWRSRVEARRVLVRQAKTLRLPATAPRDVIEAAIVHTGRAEQNGSIDCFRGIGLGQEHVLGTAVRVSELTMILNGRPLPECPVLVVDTLEPSWAVVFPRFSAIVSDLGGELSHASILLREAGIPAVVNARGAFHAIADGDLIRVDPTWGEVHVESRLGAA